MKKKAFILFLIIGAISMIVMSTHYFQSNVAGILKGKEISEHQWYLITLRLHIFLGLVAISVGPFQFMKSIRKKRIKIHRVVGYVYVVSVLISSVTGIVVAQFAMGGLTTTLGFSFLAILWFFITLSAVLAIRKGNLARHKKWAFFSYALTFSSITQRLMLLLAFVPDLAFMTVYKFSAWLPWIINLLIAYFVLKSTQDQSTT